MHARSRLETIHICASECLLSRQTHIMHTRAISWLSGKRMGCTAGRRRCTPPNYSLPRLFRCHLTPIYGGIVKGHLTFKKAFSPRACSRAIFFHNVIVWAMVRARMHTIRADQNFTCAQRQCVPLWVWVIRRVLKFYTLHTHLNIYVYTLGCDNREPLSQKTARKCFSRTPTPFVLIAVW